MFSAIAQMIFRQELVALGGSTDVIIEGDTAAVQLGEIPKQATTTAYHIQPHRESLAWKHGHGAGPPGSGGGEYIR